MSYDDVDWVDDEPISQVKLNQTEENVAAALAATDVRLVAQVITDWEFINDGPALVVTFGGVQVLSTPAFSGPVAAFDVDVSAAPAGLITVVIGHVQHKFWKTADIHYASVWIELFTQIDSPTYQLRIFNATVMAHRLQRGGY